MQISETEHVLTSQLRPEPRTRKPSLHQHAAQLHSKILKYQPIKAIQSLLEIRCEWEKEQNPKRPARLHTTCAARATWIFQSAI